MRMMAIRRDMWSSWELIPEDRKSYKRGDFVTVSAKDALSEYDVDELEFISEEVCEEPEWPSRWLTLMPEWMRHINKSSFRKTACGLELSRRWMFLDAEHAINTVKSGSRLVPCQDCLKALGLQEEAERHVR